MDNLSMFSKKGGDMEWKGKEDKTLEGEKNCDN